MAQGITLVIVLAMRKRHQFPFKELSPRGLMTRKQATAVFYLVRYINQAVGLILRERYGDRRADVFFCDGLPKTDTAEEILIPHSSTNGIFGAYPSPLQQL